jgi:hypothetical protein
MQGSEALREMKQIWKTSSGIDLNASGAPGGICTVWNTKFFREEKKLESSHWSLAHLKHLQSGITYLICNVYMPNNY